MGDVMSDKQSTDEVMRPTKKESVRFDKAGSDLDERRRIEEELRQSERDLAEAQRVARLGNWKWDLVNDEISWSSELFRILGYDAESDEASKDAGLARVHPEDRTLVEECLTALES